MQYRKFGRLDWPVSALGFGCMRLPTTDGNALSANIDAPEAIRMIRRAIESGVNYVDTAYAYHKGESERVVGRALRDGYRERVRLATKSPVWLLKTRDDFDRYLAEQLTKLQTEQLDFYLLHSLSRTSWRETVLRLGILEAAQAARADGRIKHLGFSFHDDRAAFQEIVDGFDGWDFCQIQYNYVDVEHQAGTAGLRHAAAKGLAVVVMEPLLGGRLANPPQAVREVFGRAAVRRSPADWALQWLWDQPEVSVVLSGMSEARQVQENLASAGASGVGSLRPEEHRLIAEARERYAGRVAIPCTGCSYCMPCPNEVDIPTNFRTFNEGFMYDDVTGARGEYARFIADPRKAAACVGCAACEAKCPQAIPISKWMPRVHAVLGQGRSYEEERG